MAQEISKKSELTFHVAERRSLQPKCIVLDANVLIADYWLKVEPRMRVRRHRSNRRKAKARPMAARMTQLPWRTGEADAPTRIGASASVGVQQGSKTNG